ncbi:MAG: alkaline phosphatase family protein [Candidatus Binatia bacterium]
MSEWAERARELAARRIERRKFLAGALGLSGLALARGTPLARAITCPGSGTLVDPKFSGLENIVIVMMENRSVDHYLGWLPGIDGLQEGFSNPTKLAAGGCAGTPLAVADDTAVDTYHLETHCQVPDPDHGFEGSRIEFNRGAMNGFVDRSGRVAMGYYLESDVPFLGWLAKSFTTFSSYHCSVMGPTFPNREYLYAATAEGVKTNAIPAPTPENPFPTGYTYPTILDRLTTAGVSWGVYASDVPTAALWFHNIYEHPGRVRHITDYYVDAAVGRLPQVVFLDPAFFTYGNDDHPARDIKFGQRFMMDTFLALAEGPQWPNSAYVLTYDEHGGFYDHVPPPRVSDFRASDDHCEDWAQLGFRVPTVIASPFARRAFVGTNLYDHTSILKLIEWRFCLEPLNMRDETANNLAEVLDFANADADLPSEPPFVPLHGASLYCSVSQVPEFVSEGENPLEPVPDLPVPALGRESLSEPRVNAAEPHPELLAIADSGYFGDLDMRERAKHGVWRN